ncbi:hypothetical protein SOCE26_023230 [Sorangium cellulosum]|uniref:Uncharacterized protein n=1 Tax=Sorangium cellulosum TaxID=56 RepID=A0A2L0ENN5_SORCE|nr:2'-5' RNA ligase family protein [Sorangium cellulosum]AUX40921.1 hypothetical protein SOCE26_023230 [Sorangium cellulosum]
MAGRGEAFALWLIPGGSLRERLRELIASLARETGGPAFAPHVTLLGGLRGEGAALAAQLGRLGAALRPVELRLRGPATGSTRHQCVFLDVAPAEPLAALRGAAAAVFGGDDTAFRPHVSLVYGDLLSEHRRALAADPRVAALGQEVGWAERIELWSVEGEADRWRCAGGVALPAGALSACGATCVCPCPCPSAR